MLPANPKSNLAAGTGATLPSGFGLGKPLLGASILGNFVAKGCLNRCRAVQE